MEEKIWIYLSGALNHTQRLELIRQINSDEELMKKYIRLQNIYALTNLSKSGIDKETAEKHFRKFKQQQEIKRRQQKTATFLKIAAIALLLILSSSLLTLYLTNRGAENEKMNTLYVPAGQRAKITLEDGTTVWLNAQSSLTYPSHFSKKKREVSLTGEAFFDVTSNKKRPFIVATKNIRLKVLGTRFNVYNYPESYFQASLIEGSVEIGPMDNPASRVILKPHEQLTFRNGKIKVSSIANEDHILWRKGIYCFQNERLIDIIEKLQLYYDVKIIVKNPEIFDVRYTGKFRQRDGIDEILRLIKKIQHFNIEKNTEENIIILTK